jgi:hypothetical protein
VAGAWKTADNLEGRRAHGAAKHICFAIGTPERPVKAVESRAKATVEGDVRRGQLACWLVESQGFRWQFLARILCPLLWRRVPAAALRQPEERGEEDFARASANAQPGAKVAQWSQAPFTNVLPERWIVIGQVLAVGPSISDSLAMGPDPNGTGPTSDEGMRWVTDFDRAIQVGMAFRITLTPAQQRGFNRIVVLGLRSDLDVSATYCRRITIPTDWNCCHTTRPPITPKM